MSDQRWMSQSCNSWHISTLQDFICNVLSQIHHSTSQDTEKDQRSALSDVRYMRGQWYLWENEVHPNPSQWVQVCPLDLKRSFLPVSNKSAS